jgi:hypothetical protein
VILRFHAACRFSPLELPLVPELAFLYHNEFWQEGGLYHPFEYVVLHKLLYRVFIGTKGLITACGSEDSRYSKRSCQITWTVIVFLTGELGARRNTWRISCGSIDVLRYRRCDWVDIVLASSIACSHPSWRAQKQ